MKWILIILIIFGIVLFFTSCSTTQKIATLKPEATSNSPILYKTKTSFVALPVEITLKDIEKQLNQSIKGLIYNDSILKDDNSEMKIWKTENITLTEKEGNIISKISLKIWLKVKYGTDFLGLNDTKELYLDGVVSLKSKAHLTNWKLTTTSSITELKWNESPSVVIAGKTVPITYLVNPTISLFKTRLAKEIDTIIDKNCDFKPLVMDAIEKISTPFQANKEYSVWFKIIPKELYVTEAVLEQQKIALQMGLKCNIQTVVGQEPKNNFQRDDLVLKPVSNMPDNSNIAIAAVSTFKSASKIITTNFKGMEFGSGGKKIKIEKVNIWQKDNKVIVALDVSGSITGAIYLSGYPSYNTITKEIFFDQLDYVLDTKNVLIKSASWFAQGTILKKIQESCRYSIAENLEDAKKNMEYYLNNYSPVKGVYIKGNMNQFEFEKIELTENAIIAFLSTSGKIKIAIDGMD